MLQETPELPLVVVPTEMAPVGGIGRGVARPVPADVGARAKKIPQEGAFECRSHRPLLVREVAAEVGNVARPEPAVTSGEVELRPSGRLPREAGSPSGTPSIPFVERPAVVPNGPFQHGDGGPVGPEHPSDLERGIPLVAHFGTED